MKWGAIAQFSARQGLALCHSDSRMSKRVDRCWGASVRFTKGTLLTTCCHCNL
jgi:hypothetical protein